MQESADKIQQNPSRQTVSWSFLHTPATQFFSGPVTGEKSFFSPAPVTIAAKSAPEIQRQVSEERGRVEEELETHIPADHRTGSVSDTLDRFSERIPSLSNMEALAASYGMAGHELLAFFMTEGGFGDGYDTPASLGFLPVRSLAGLAGFHLWSKHGLDDFTLVTRVSGASDNSFDDRQDDAAYRNQILRALNSFYRLGLLWGADGLRPASPAQQLSPDTILGELAGAVSLATQLPGSGFPMLALRLQAAVMARRQGLIGRSADQLTQLGYTAEVADRFGYWGYTLERIRVAREAGLIAEGLPQAEAATWVRDHESDAGFSQALLADEGYRDYITESFDRRTTTGAARISMGAPGYYYTRLEQTARDFALWRSTRSRNLREELYSWAQAHHVSAAIIGGPAAGASRDAIAAIRSGTTAEYISSAPIRDIILDLLEMNERGAATGTIFSFIEFILDAYNRYHSTDTPGLWLQAVLDPEIDTSGIPAALIRAIMPSAISLDTSRVRNYGIYLAWARRVIEARRTLETDAPSE